MSKEINENYLVHLIQTKQNPEKVQRFTSVLNAVQQNKAQYGKVSPFGVPEWITPRVATGGFVVPNEFMAGGPITEQELQIAKLLSWKGRAEDLRSHINEWSLTSDGASFWLSLLREKRIIIPTVEEGCILSLLVLLDKGKISSPEISAIVPLIAPYFSTLRFFPEISPKTLDALGVLHQVSLSKIKDIQCKFNTMQNNLYKEAFNEALIVQDFLPLYDELVALIRTSIEDNDAEAWPFQIPPSEHFRQQFKLIQKKFALYSRPKTIPAARLDAELSKSTCNGYFTPEMKAKFLRKEYFHTRRLRKGNFAVLMAGCTAFVKGSLTGRLVGKCRRVLSDIQQKTLALSQQGLLLNSVREKQFQTNANVGVANFHACTIWEKLKQQNPEDSLSPETQNTLLHEALTSAGLNEKMKEKFSQMLQRCTLYPLSTLIELGLVPSPTVLAAVGAKLAASAASAGVGDAEGRLMLYLLHTAFAQRRSVLLLNFNTQVKFADIPWVKLFRDHMQGDTVAQQPPAQGGRMYSLASVGEGERQCIAELARCYLLHFAGVQMPNELKKVFASLGLRPLCDQLADDIFEGDYSKNFACMFKETAYWLAHSPYSHYYQLDAELYPASGKVALDTPLVYSAVFTALPPQPLAATSPPFSVFVRVLYEQLTGTPCTTSEGILATRCFNDCAAILTTHNILPLFLALKTVYAAEPEGMDLLLRLMRKAVTMAFSGLCHSVNAAFQEYRDSGSFFRTHKAVGQAWRQFLALFSLCQGLEVGQFAPDDPQPPQPSSAETARQRAEAVHEFVEKHLLIKHEQKSIASDEETVIRHIAAGLRSPKTFPVMSWSKQFPNQQKKRTNEDYGWDL